MLRAKLQRRLLLLCITLPLIIMMELKLLRYMHSKHRNDSTDLQYRFTLSHDGQVEYELNNFYPMLFELFREQDRPICQEIVVSR